MRDDPRPLLGQTHHREHGEDPSPGAHGRRTQAAAGSGDSQQLASSRQGKKWSQLPTRVPQEALSMCPAFHTVESGRIVTQEQVIGSLANRRISILVPRISI